MVFGHHRPAISQRFGVIFACVNHGLDRDRHARLEQDIGGVFVCCACFVVQHLRLFVKTFANAVAAVVTHHRAALAMGETLNGRSDFVNVIASLDRCNPVPHCVVGDGAQPPCSYGRGFSTTQHEHAAGITMPAVLDDGDVDIQNISLAQRLVVRNAMADLVVDRGANGLGIRVVAARVVVQRGGNDLELMHHEVIGQLVQLIGRFVGFDERGEVIQNLRGNSSRDAHSFDFFCIFDCDGHKPLILPKAKIDFAMPSDLLPTLYTFRRCPYAIRARMALAQSGIDYQAIEVSLKAKPPQLIAVSPKATVPVLCLPTGEVIDQSLAIMRWALAHNTPHNPAAAWLADCDVSQSNRWIEQCDAVFKPLLDRYKYATRYPEFSLHEHRERAMDTFIRPLEVQMAAQVGAHSGGYLLSHRPSLADVAIMPFVRQFAAVDVAWFESQPLPRVQAWLWAWVNSALFISIMKPSTH
jgi:glutathione S-transferase